jgi:glycosyltransferase involved in cell wall biosynthesis
MKIAYLFSDHKHTVLRDAGDSVHIQEMCRAFDEAGHSVFVVAAERGDNSGAFTQLDVRETGKPAVVEPFHRMRGRGLSQSGGRRLGREESSDPAWQLGAVAHDTSRIAWAAAWNTWFYRRARDVISRERPDVLYERYVPFGVAGTTLAASFGLPLVVEMNTSFTFPTEAWRQHSPLDTAATRWTERYIATHTDHIIAVSATIQEYLIGIGAHPERVSILANAADPQVFRQDPAARHAVRRAFDLHESSVVVGFVGSLKRWHGVDVLLEAAAILRNEGLSIRFLIVGDGPLRQELADHVVKAGLESFVMFSGAVGRSQVVQYLNAFDIAVAPAPILSTFHFSPLKIFEYMAVGTAVVAARYPEIQAIVDEGETGLLFSPGDPVELAGVIARLAADKRLRAELGRRGRDAIEANHTWAHRAQYVTQLYEDIAAERRTAGSPKTGERRMKQPASS